MNLYEIRFVHYAPKDSKEGTVCYLVAKDDENVYEWLKVIEGFTSYEHYTIYKDSEEEGDKLDGVPFRESIIESRGCANNENIELHDLYYGATTYYWKAAKENISEDEIKMIKDMGIKIAIDEE